MTWRTAMPAQFLLAPLQHYYKAELSTLCSAAARRPSQAHACCETMWCIRGMPSTIPPAAVLGGAEPHGGKADSPDYT